MISKFVAFANNATQVNLATQGNITKTADIQAKASQAAIMLTTLQSNTTLTTTCEAFNAVADKENSCTQIFVLQAFVKFAANETAVATMTNNDATKIADIQLKASMASTKLETLTSNSTLEADCPAILVKDECKFMSGVAKFVAFSKYQTMLDMVTGGNTTKKDEIKKIAIIAQIKLGMVNMNLTIVAKCDALKTDASNSQKGTTSSAANTTSGTKLSAIRMINPGIFGGAVASSVLVVVVGMMLV